MHISSLKLQGNYITHRPMSYISVDKSGDIYIDGNKDKYSISFNIYSKLNGKSKIEIINDGAVVNAAKLYNQQLVMDSNIYGNGSIHLCLHDTDEVFIDDIFIDEINTMYYGSYNTNSVVLDAPIESKENAIAFVVDSNFIGFLDLFLLTLKTHNCLDNVDLIGIVPSNDNVVKEFLLSNNIKYIEYSSVLNISKLKPLIYVDIAHLCASEYICFIDLDTMILDSVIQIFDFAKSLPKDSILACEEQGVNDSENFISAFDISGGIYPNNNTMSYINSFISKCNNSFIINNGVLCGSRIAWLQLSNYIKSYATYFRRWIQENESKCAWAEQAIINIALLINQKLVLLHPTYNVQANTEMGNISMIGDNYKYNNEPIKVLHLNGGNRNRYNEYFAFGMKKYNWNALKLFNDQQISKLFPSYIDSDVDYGFIDNIKCDKLLCYTNKLSILKYIKDCDIKVITNDYVIDAIFDSNDIDAESINDLLIYMNKNDLSKYDYIIIDDVSDQYLLRSIVDLMRAGKILIPIYCKVDSSSRINKIFANLLNTSICIEHIVSDITKVYNYHFVKIYEKI